MFLGIKKKYFFLGIKKNFLGGNNFFMHQKFFYSVNFLFNIKIYFFKKKIIIAIIVVLLGIKKMNSSESEQSDNANICNEFLFAKDSRYEWNN